MWTDFTLKYYSMVHKFYQSVAIHTKITSKQTGLLDMKVMKITNCQNQPVLARCYVRENIFTIIFHSITVAINTRMGGNICFFNWKEIRNFLLLFTLL